MMEEAILSNGETVSYRVVTRAVAVPYFTPAEQVMVFYEVVLPSGFKGYGEDFQQAVIDAYRNLDDDDSFTQLYGTEGGS
jgi:hypothetical protein